MSTLILIIIIVVIITIINVEAEVVRLSRYQILKDEITVSGVSAGAFMSIQLHVAHSALIKGAGSIAGAVYNCANGNETVGYDVCCYAKQPVNVAEIIARTDKWADDGQVDPTSNLAKSKVYIFWGTEDKLVLKPPSDWAEEFYRHYKADVTYDYTIPAAHAFVTDFYGNLCGTQGPPGIVNCNHDLAGLMLKKFYGELKPRVQPSNSLSGYFIEFGQSEFFADDEAYGLGPTGWVYVPKSCTLKGTACRLHVVLHGCRQGVTNPLFGLNIVLNTGYNYWADTNNIVVLYPQASNNEMQSNWCFDWAGDGPGFTKSHDNYSTKQGHHIRTLIAMINHIISSENGNAAAAGPQCPYIITLLILVTKLIIFGLTSGDRALNLI